MNPHTSDLLRGLGNVRRFADLAEKMLDAEATSLGENVAAMAERYPEADRQDLFESHAEDFFELSDELPSILRYSVVTQAHSLLERYLDQTAQTYMELSKPSVRLQDLVGKGLRRAHQYLKKVAGVEFPEDMPEWIEIQRLQELRNCIVHADGCLKGDAVALKKWINGTPGLRLSPGGVVTLERGFSDAVIRSYIRFAEAFDELCKPLCLMAAVFSPIAHD